ncbi:MAG: zinc transporter ZntB [Gammaproteobacteria bacterium]|nr:zinc transporter ZntB [Gammaproteobacteria bacterium]NNF49205.1 zinc transporter ZntB [Woeseiaceae bacterium]MBT8095147.1 zinc transporter ZntB [Gammaproteobacteria bacterium]MBT8106192.1 zinc transporter ZntB [Gammaproteobacteria bacterium]NNK26206.1 zinc transporter ZntB [Woeseiaceae bacterium]
MRETTPEFLHCCILNRRGGSVDIDFASMRQWNKDQGILWVHIEVGDDASRTWLANDSGLEQPVVEALLADETRPRSLATAQGLLVVLRGVNTNPGDDPEDMVSIRLWIEHDRVISTRRRQLLSVVDIRDALGRGEGPSSTGGFLAGLTGRLADRIGDFVDGIEDRVSDAEETMATQDQTAFRQSITAVRRQIASVRRFLAPQRDALDRLYRQPGAWLSDSETQELREEADRITRYLEDLELARERTMVLREEFLGQLAQEQNARMYVLSVVAAIFLPLTFVTGLLGMNVGGLPGLDSPSGFLGSMVVMILAAAGLLALFRWKRWL